MFNARIIVPEHWCVVSKIPNYFNTLKTEFERIFLNLQLRILRKKISQVRTLKNTGRGFFLTQQNVFYQCLTRLSFFFT